MAVLLTFLGLSCDRDCNVCPEEPPSAESYRLYAVSGLNPEGLLMSIDVPADTIVESTGSISITPDGKTIYIIDGENCMLGYMPMITIWVFNALTHGPIAWIAPYTNPTREWVPPCLGSMVITPDMTRGIWEPPRVQVVRPQFLS